MGLWSKPPRPARRTPPQHGPGPSSAKTSSLGHGATGKTLSALQKTAAHTEEDPPPPGPRQAQTRRKAWHPLPPQTPRPPDRPSGTSTENARRNQDPDADRALHDRDRQSVPCRVIGADMSGAFGAAIAVLQACMMGEGRVRI